MAVNVPSKGSILKQSRGLGAPFANGVFWLVSAIPLRGLQLCGRFFGAVMLWLPGSYKRRAQENLRFALPESGEQHLAACLKHVASLFLEMPYWYAARDSEQQIKAQAAKHDWSEVDALLVQGKGLILVSPHVGNFELLGPVFSQRHPSTVMYRVPRIRWLREWLLNLRSQSQLQMVPADVAGVRALAKTLKAGHTIGLLPDQVPIEGEGVWAPFFGQPAYTTTLVQRLQKLTDAPVVVLGAYRLPEARGFEIKHWVIESPWPDDATASAAKLNKALEQAILHEPDQYLWGYDRFRKPRARQGKRKLARS